MANQNALHQRSLAAFTPLKGCLLDGWIKGVPIVVISKNVAVGCFVLFCFMFLFDIFYVLFVFSCFVCIFNIFFTCFKVNVTFWLVFIWSDADILRMSHHNICFNKLVASLLESDNHCCHHRHHNQHMLVMIASFVLVWIHDEWKAIASEHTVPP